MANALTIAPASETVPFYESQASGKEMAIAPDTPVRVEYAGFREYEGFMSPVVLGGQQFYRVDLIYEDTNEDEEGNRTTSRTIGRVLLNPRFIFSLEFVDSDDLDVTPEERAQMLRAA